MRAWGRGLVAIGLTAMASGACSCSTSSPPRMAQLSAIVVGQGPITVTEALTGFYATWLTLAPDPDCDAGVCVETLNNGGRTTYTCPDRS